MTDINKTSEDLVEKWSGFIDHPRYEKITDHNKKAVVAALLENSLEHFKKKRLVSEDQSKMLLEGAPANSSGSYADTGGFAIQPSVLMDMFRRSAPQLIAFDVCGLQPLNQQSGVFFAMKSRYSTQGGTEALYNEADTDFSGTGTHAGSNPVSGTYTTGTGFSVSAAERLGGGATGDGSIAEMAMTIEKVNVVAKERKLKANVSRELMEDMRNSHGLDARSEFMKILSGEITSEINREVIRTMYVTAKPGAQVGTATAGTFDLDVDSSGRWSQERWSGLAYQIKREKNAIWQQTRIAPGNFLICSADVAAALEEQGKFAMYKDQPVPFENGSTYAGTLRDGMKVFVDPYSSNVSADQFALIGLKADNMRAGLFYCPYIPLEFMEAVNYQTMNPVLGFRTRYAIAANPMVDLDDSSGSTGDLIADKNYFFRRLKITNML